MTAVETFSLTGWSQKALDYLLYLAEHPLSTSKACCEAIDVKYDGHNAYDYRKKYNGWKEVEQELRSSPESCSAFIARMGLASVTKSMVETGKSGGKNAVAASSFVKQAATPVVNPGPAEVPSWLEGLLGPGTPAVQIEAPKEKVIEADWKELLK